MSKHTPGPWSVYEDANKVAAHGAKHLISSSAYGDYYTESLTDERGEFFNPADARLVAAAPDLLEALYEGRRAIGDHHAPNDCYATGPMTGDEYRDLVQCPACSFIAMYDAAIAKAKGESA